MKLKIIKCSDSQLWYADQIGKELPVQHENADGYWCREPAGYLNVVRREDAEVVEKNVQS